MRTVQLTLDEALVAQVDALAKRLGTTRSALSREALRDLLARKRAQAKERAHRAGYRRKPATKGEFDAWHGQQVWGDD
jgi:metal-responsive CopG/Arc/MetJ family transcriptional regulator